MSALRGPMIIRKVFSRASIILVMTKMAVVIGIVTTREILVEGKRGRYIRRQIRVVHSFALVQGINASQ